MAWSSPKCNGEIPNKRSGHTLTLRSNSSESALYLFGGLVYYIIEVMLPAIVYLTYIPVGCDHKSPPGPTDDLFKLDITNG